jgi:exosome complex component RRP46
MTFSATLMGVDKSGAIITDLSAADAKAAASLHVLAFTSKNHLLLSESEGRFDFDTWEQVRERALSICQDMTTPGPDGDVTMGEEADGSRPEGFVRETVEDRLYKDYSWKIDSI